MDMRKVCVDPAFGMDFSGETILDDKLHIVSQRIIHTDNPDTNSWLERFLNKDKK